MESIVYMCVKIKIGIEEDTKYEGMRIGINLKCVLSPHGKYVEM